MSEDRLQSQTAQSLDLWVGASPAEVQAGYLRDLDRHGFTLAANILREVRDIAPTLDALRKFVAVFDLYRDLGFERNSQSWQKLCDARDDLSDV